LKQIKVSKDTSVHYYDNTLYENPRIFYITAIITTINEFPK